MQNIDLAEFKEVENITKPLAGIVVIKSQDQPERRRRMMENLKSGDIGRVTERPVSEGLVLSTGKLGTKETIDFNNCRAHTFQEPRHIIRYRDGFLLTDITSMLLLDSAFNIIRRITNPFFAFLHTLALDHAGSKVLVVSSGYDAILEIDLRDFTVAWEWFGWEHGLAKNNEGVICTRLKEKAEEYARQGTAHLFINPDEYSTYGVPTNLRTTHPNAAIYGEGKTAGKVIISMGAKGQLAAIDKKSGKYEIIYGGFAKMPHGIKRFGNGWIATNTLKAEFCFFNDSFELQKTVSLKNLGHKVPEAGGGEWVQQVIPVSENLFLALDANRGLIFFDLREKTIFYQEINQNWCVQDCIF